MEVISEIALFPKYTLIPPMSLHFHLHHPRPHPLCWVTKIAPAGPAHSHPTILHCPQRPERDLFQSGNHLPLPCGFFLILRINTQLFIIRPAKRSCRVQLSPTSFSLFVVLSLSLAIWISGNKIGLIVSLSPWHTLIIVSGYSWATFSWLDIQLF